MLKLYKATIITSLCIAVCTFGVALLCEYWQISHRVLIQNFAIGLFCSLLVVVVTSVLQYKHTQSNLVKEYARALWALVDRMGSAYRTKDCNFTDEFYKDLLEKIDAAFDRFDLYSDELVWFSPKKQRYTKTIHACKSRMQRNYLLESLQSDKAAVLYFSRNTDYISMLDSAIALFDGSKIGDILQVEKDFSIKQNR